MTELELVERLTTIVMEQAEIIQTQAEALSQFGAVEGLDGRIEMVRKTREEILGE